MEHRKHSVSKPSLLPVDYLRMVKELFSANFDLGLQAYSQKRPNSFFEVQGDVTSHEVLLAVSLMSENQLAATTVYASCDFDPQASTPTVHDLLAACLDAIGNVFNSLLTPENPEILDQLADESLSALENVPFQWTELEINKKRVFVKVDKANLQLDQMANDWLKKNDPDLEILERKIEEETEALFVTGPKKKDSNSH